MRLIREAIGPDIKLMCDINQRWRPEQAIDIGRRVEDAGVGLFWLEDVTTHDDYAGLARVADALVDPGRRRRICLGHRAVPPHDGGALGRYPDDRPGALGGITQWLKVAGMAEAFNLPVVSHG
jgi:L-alanine-DL-glutamate epimerase-like enolase superfamily enzyme